MTSTNNSCVLDVPCYNPEQATGLCRSLVSKLPFSFLEYDTKAGTLKINNEGPIRVYEHLDDCVDDLKRNGMVNQTRQLLANPSAFSASDARTGALDRHVILHHKDKSMSIIPGGEPKLDDNLSWESMDIEQHHREGTEKASVCPGSLTNAAGQGWSHTATEKFHFPIQPDPSHTRLRMLVEDRHQTEDVPSQKQAYSVI